MTTDRFSQFRSNAFSRRVILRGAGCTMALPWLESVNALADTPTAADFPKRFGVMFLGCGINENHWSAEGNGADMKLSKTLSPLEPLKQKINVIDGLYVKALTNQGIHPGADRQPVVGRAHHQGRHHPFRHQRGPDDRQPCRPGHAAILHRAGLRTAHDRLSRDQFLAGLQLASVLADPGFAGAGRGLSGAGLGQPVRQSRQPAQCQRAGPHQGPGPGRFPPRSAPPTAARWTNSSPACARSKSASS